MAEHPGRVVFGHSIEGLFHIALRDRVTPRLKQRVKELGIDLDHPLNTAYPREAYVAALECVRQELFGTLPPQEGMREIGRVVVRGYVQTMLGKAVAAMIRLIGPKRALGRMTKSLRSANNYADTRIVEKGERECEIWINETETAPEYFEGVFEVVLETAGAAQPQVRSLGRDQAGTSYSARW